MQRTFLNLKVILSLLTVLLIVLLAMPTFAQTSRGTVSGAVTDSSGGIIPGVRVELTNSATGVMRSTITNEAGLYRFDAVDLGDYTLKIAMPSFKTYTSTAFHVEANRTITIDAKLEVGGGETVIQVSAETAELLIKDAPIRGGNFKPQEVSQLPLAVLSPISLARTLPGVILPSGSTTFGNGGAAGALVAVNGQRPRGNNNLLDGTENNDISVGGPAQAFNMLDAVQEFSAQTGNFGVEFGRAGGGVFNIITKSGTNNYHGTALWQYRSQRFNSQSNVDKLNRTPKSVFSNNIYGFTVGGPVRKNKTFFFGAFQQDTYRSTRNFTFILPTEEAVTSLRSLFPSNPRLDLYLNALGNLRGSANPRNIQLGGGRGAVTFGALSLGLPYTSGGPQWLIRVDHNLSAAHILSFRYVYASSLTTPSAIDFPGFIDESKGRDQNFLFTDSFTISPTWTNEFRFSYGRIGFDFPISPKSVALAKTLPRITIPNISTLGIATNIPQFRFANNWLFQETQSKVRGHHTFRYGVEILRQLARQRPPFNKRGSLTYTNAANNFTGFANFLDDFSGPSGSTARNFGDPVYYPNLFRQSYFFQDTWKARPSLTLTLGLRYENFGQPANIFKFPAFAGFDPDKFLVPNKVNRADKNFGPAFGLAWSPSFKSGLLGRLFGEGRTVWRGGFQITYDTWFNNLLSNMAADTPNTINTIVTGAPPTPANPRGTPNWFAALPAAARTPRLTDAQQAVFDKNIRNPYTERWSFGFQRELPRRVLLELSYVGSASHKLFTSEDLNPLQPSGVRLYPNFGIRRIRASEGNSIYHALQLGIDRRFANNFMVRGSYTWSRNLDSTSEVFATDNSNSQFTSMPISQGGLRIDRGLSDYHRKHRLTIVYQWDLPGPQSGLWRHPFGGWSITGITTFQSGAPFTIANGFDRNSDGIVTNDRPDIGNPNAPLNTRAIVDSACSTGFRNPDISPTPGMGCVLRTDVRFVQGTGFPNSSTVGRNTLSAGSVKNFDMNIRKTFVIKEEKRLEFRWEAFNIFNHPQFTSVAGLGHNVLGTLGPSGGLPSRFLNRDFTNSGTRTMRLQLKFLF